MMIDLYGSLSGFPHHSLPCYKGPCIGPWGYHQAEMGMKTSAAFLASLNASTLTEARAIPVHKLLNLTVESGTYGGVYPSVDG